MATIANRYYNSPWIAEAGRNLASALAPPDPNEQLRNEAARFNFERAKSEASYTDKQRAEFDVADEYLGKLEGMTPIMDATTGKIDYDATDAQARTLGDAALKHGGREYYTAVDKALGKASPQYAARQAMLVAQANEQIRRDNNRGEININLQNLKEGGLDRRNTANNQNRLDVQKLRNDASYALEYEKWKHRNQGVNVKLVPSAMVKTITDLLDQYEYDSGARMSQMDYGRMLDESVNETLATGNPAGAVLSVWEKHKPEVTQVPEQNYFSDLWRSMHMNPTDPKLVPKFDAEAAPTAPTNFSDAMPGAGAAPPSAAPPAAPPSQSGPPARLLKEGVETTFKGKGTWTLKNGVPTRVK